MCQEELHHPPVAKLGGEVQAGKAAWVAWVRPIDIEVGVQEKRFDEEGTVLLDPVEELGGGGFIHAWEKNGRKKRRKRRRKRRKKKWREIFFYFKKTWLVFFSSSLGLAAHVSPRSSFSFLLP